MAALSTGMEKAAMKQLLARATVDSPVHYAFGLGKETSVALLKMDKIKNSKACEKLLTEEFGDAKNTRWGTVAVADEDGKEVVRFIVNKVVSGMAKRLTKTLRGTGYKEVVLVTEDGETVDGAADAEDEAATPAGAEVAARDAGPAQADRNGKDKNTVPVQAGVQVEAAEATRMMAAMVKLTQQVAAVIAKHPEAKADLTDRLFSTRKAMRLIPADFDEHVEDVEHAIERLQAPKDQTALAGQDVADPKLIARLGELVKRIPAIVVINPPSKKQFVELAGEANAKLKAGENWEAESRIKNLASLMSAIETIQANLQERADDIIAQAARLPEPGKSDIQQKARSALAIKDSQIKREAWLEDVEQELADAAKRARVAEAARASGGSVKFRLLQRDWVSAQQRARTQLAAFVKTVLEDEEVKADEDFDDIAKAMNELARQMPDFGSEIDTALAAIDDASDDASRKKARDKAVSVLRGYSTMLDGSETLRDMQELADAEYGGIAFVSELQSAIALLSSQIGKAA